MQAAIAFIPLVESLLFITLLAVVTGIVSRSKVAALRYWSIYPWRFFWFSYVLMLPGALLWTGSESVALVLLLPGVVLMFGSAIQGLRVTGLRSKQRARMILVISFLVVVLPRLTQGWLMTVISSALVILLWMFSAWLADTVGSRRSAGTSSNA